MYGDSDVMRRRADQLREQAVDLRSLADQLVAQTEGIGWTGRAADSMRERVRERASHLRDAAAQHDTAADSLDRHVQEVDTLKDAITDTERKATTLVADARTRVARIDAANEAEPDVRREPDADDRTLAEFTPAPQRSQGLAGRVPARTVTGAPLPTIDLSTPPPAPDGMLDALPRRAALTLPELRLVAEAAGGAPLPFDVAEPGGGSESGALEDRLGQSRGTVEDQAYLRGARLPARPDASLGASRPARRRSGRRGPARRRRAARHPAPRARRRHRRRPRAGQGLAPACRRGGRDAVHGRRHRVRAGVVPDGLVARRAGPGRGDPGGPHPAASPRCPPRRTSPTSWPTRRPRRCAARATTWSPCSPPATPARSTTPTAPRSTEVETGRLLAALAAEARGRLRVLAADVSGEETSVVGVVSWVLLADGWRALTPHRAGGARGSPYARSSRTTSPPTSPRCSRR